MCRIKESSMCFLRVCFLPLDYMEEAMGNVRRKKEKKSNMNAAGMMCLRSVKRKKVKNEWMMNECGLTRKEDDQLKWS